MSIFSKPIVFGIGLLLTLLSGVILSQSGKPYNTLLFTLHKFITLGTVIIFATSVYRTAQADAVRTTFMLIFVATGLVFISLILSGGLLSAVVDSGLQLAESTFNRVLRFHQTLPILAALVSLLSGYLLFILNKA